MWKLLVAGVILAGAVISYAAITDGDSDSGKSTVAQQGSLDDEALDEENDWANAYCPNALPLLKMDETPYLPLQIKYSREGNDRKELWAAEKGDQYQTCAQFSDGMARTALLANSVYQTKLKRGTDAEVKLYSKEQSKART